MCAWCGGALAAPAELAEGAILDGRYEVRRVIGRGGFGITYEVTDQRLERAVAIKELFPPSAVRHGRRGWSAWGGCFSESGASSWRSEPVQGSAPNDPT